MRVRVKLFAGHRERVGQSELMLDVPYGTSVAGAFDILAHQHPALAPMQSFTTFARNRKVVEGSEILAEGDELALLQPVSGGTSTILMPKTSQRSKRTITITIPESTFKRAMSLPRSMIPVYRPSGRWCERAVRPHPLNNPCHEGLPRSRLNQSHGGPLRAWPTYELLIATDGVPA